MENQELAGMGHNNPPEPTDFELIESEISGLFLEATNWCDGEPIVSQAQADEVGKLINQIRKAAKKADELRKEEVAPFDKGKAEVQARYAPLISDTKSVKGKTVLALEDCKKILAPWLDKIDQEKKAKAEKARKEAEEKEAAAFQAMMEAREADDLAAKEAAVRLTEEAQKAAKKASYAEKDKAKTAGGRAVTLRSVFTPELSDPVLAARHYWEHRQEEMRGLLLRLAEQDVRAGKREIPGFTIKEEKVAQ